MGIATREAYGKALEKLAEKKEVVVLDADLGAATKSATFKKVAPERYFDMGIAEANMIGTAAGLAAGGKIPFASTFAVFATGRAFEQIRNSVAYPKLNVKIAATHAGVTVGEDGGSHQAIEDLALMRSLPNLVVVNPADAMEAEQAILALAEYEAPAYIRLGRAAVPDLHKEGYQFRLGKGEILKEGKDVAILATGIMTGKAMEAAEMLEKDGIHATVVNLATIKPLDTELILEVAKKTGKIVTAEEHSIIGGLGSAVAETLAEGYPVPMKRIGVEDVFGQSGDPESLLNHYGLTAENIAKAAKSL